MVPCSDTLLVLLGPTGVGKTELSLRLAEHYACPIVSADSRQVFREIPVGTAAPTREEQQRVPHYLIGTRSLQDDYNAGAYERDAIHILQQLQQLRPSHSASSPFAILTGGSMMYIDAVCKGLDDIPKVDPDLRLSIQNTYRQKGLAWLQNEVKRLDPDYWETVDKMNPQRLIHCLEISMNSGIPYSSYRKREQGEITSRERPWNILKIGINRHREQLYNRINLRVEQMMRDGLEDEARQVYPMRHLNSLNTVGYKEMFAYFDGIYTRDEAVRMIQQNSRHYAKRQMTWFNRDNEIHWLDATLPYEEQIATIDALLAEFDGLHTQNA